MEILGDGFEVKPRGVYGKYTGLYEELLSYPPGTLFELVCGEDFVGDPRKFVSTVRTGLWNRGWRVNARVVEGSVFLRIPGPRGSVSGSGVV